MLIKKSVVLPSAMKKAISLFFTLLANLILLVHAVVPHHHHEDIACFTNHFNTEHGITCHQHENHDPGNDHDTDHENDNCSLHELLAIVPDRIRQEQLQYFFNDRPEACTYAIIAKTAMLDPSELHTASGEYIRKPYLLRTYRQVYTCSNSLRAPPYC